MARPSLAKLLLAALGALALAGCGASSSSTTSSQFSLPTTDFTSTSTPASAPSTTGPPTASTSQTSTTATTPARTTSSTTTPSGGATPGGSDAGFTLSSPALAGGTFPAQFTCDGADISLPLQWTGVPAAAKELVLAIRDPDASGGTFFHWAVAGIAPRDGGFPAGGVSGYVIPGRNSYGTLGYHGPCPPAGSTHRYVITLSALAQPSGLAPGFSPDQLDKPALATAMLAASYSRR